MQLNKYYSWSSSQRHSHHQSHPIDIPSHPDRHHYHLVEQDAGHTGTQLTIWASASPPLLVKSWMNFNWGPLLPLFHSFFSIQSSFSFFFAPVLYSLLCAVLCISSNEVLCWSSYHLNFWAFSRTFHELFSRDKLLGQFPFRLNILEFVIDDYFELWWKQNGLLSAFRTLFSLCNNKLLISCYKPGDKLLPL